MNTSNMTNNTHTSSLEEESQIKQGVRCTVNITRGRVDKSRVGEDVHSTFLKTGLTKGGWGGCTFNITHTSICEINKR